MPKPDRPRIGEYRHTPAGYVQLRSDGTLLPVRMRRRFPYQGIVFLAYGMLGPLVCAGVALLFKLPGLTVYSPKRLSDLPLAPSPTLDNVLFGAGLHELVLACGLTGWLLWRFLWKMRLPDQVQKQGFRGVLRPLTVQGLLMGTVFTFCALPIASIGLFLRTGPGNIPWFVKPLFGLLSMPIITISYVLTGVVPLVLLILGLLLGAATALTVALGWQYYPEEPDTR